MRLATSLHCFSQTAQGQRRFRSPRRAVLCPRSPRNTQTARECCLQKCIARPLHAKATVLRECYGIYYIYVCFIQDDMVGGVSNIIYVIFGAPLYVISTGGAFMRRSGEISKFGYPTSIRLDSSSRHFDRAKRVEKSQSIYTYNASAIP